MRFILPFLLFSTSVFAQKPELSMELFLQPNYNQLLPFTEKEIGLHKKLGISKIKISSSKNTYSIYSLNKSGKPIKHVNYQQIKTKFLPTDSTLYQYSDLSQVISIKSYINGKMELDSFSYSGSQLTGIFYKTSDSSSINICNNGFTTKLLLQDSISAKPFYKFGSCIEGDFLYLDSANNFVKFNSENQMDFTSSNKDTTFYWQKKDKKLAILKKEILANGLPSRTLIKSSESNNWIKKECSYNLQNQITSIVSTGVEGSYFFTYFPGGLLKTKIHSQSDPQWKYNYFLKPQKEEFTVPVSKYSYQKFDGSWVK